MQPNQYRVSLCVNSKLVQPEYNCSTWKIPVLTWFLCSESHLQGWFIEKSYAAMLSMPKRSVVQIESKRKRRQEVTLLKQADHSIAIFLKAFEKLLKSL